jgi:hypothetical protein
MFDSAFMLGQHVVLSPDLTLAWHYWTKLYVSRFTSDMSGSKAVVSSFEFGLTDVAITLVISGYLGSVEQPPSHTGCR